MVPVLAFIMLGSVFIVIFIMCVFALIKEKDKAEEKSEDDSQKVINAMVSYFKMMDMTTEEKAKEKVDKILSAFKK